jgi:hypothetical protein
MVLATLGSASLQEPDLRSWLEVHAGLEGKRLQAAVELCESEDIGTVGELREVHDSGRFGALGFKPVSAGRIEQALAAVAPYERRRTQDGASATCNPDIARLEARLDAEHPLIMPPPHPQTQMAAHALDINCARWCPAGGDDAWLLASAGPPPGGREGGREAESLWVRGRGGMGGGD